MDRMLRLARGVATFGAWLGGALLILASAVVGVEVLLRRFLDVSIGGADELAGYALAIGTAWSLGFALVHRAHIRIDSLYVLLPRPVQVALDLAGVAALAGFFALVAWHGYGVLVQSIEVGARSMSRLGVPVALPQALWMLGLVAFLFVAAIVLAAAVAALAGRDVAGAQLLIGSRTATQELEEELETLGPGRGSAEPPPERAP